MVSCGSPANCRYRVDGLCSYFPYPDDPLRGCQWKGKQRTVQSLLDGSF